MRTRLRMKCKACGHWNSIEVNKFFLEQETSEPKVKAYIPMYEPLKVEMCKKCGKIITGPIDRSIAKEGSEERHAFNFPSRHQGKRLWIYWNQEGFTRNLGLA
jgi:hypothetical protein